MVLVLFLAAPPAVQAPASPSILERFLAERLAEGSDPELREALRRVWSGSPLFQESLEALYREQPKVRIKLSKVDSESFGDLVLCEHPEAYPLAVSVQWRGVRRGVDMAEPWLASILFALLEVSRRDGVIPTQRDTYLFETTVKRRMWNYQAQVRKELKASDPLRYAGLAVSGEHLYWNVFPSKPRLNRD